MRAPVPRQAHCPERGRSASTPNPSPGASNSCALRTEPASTGAAPTGAVQHAQRPLPRLLRLRFASLRSARRRSFGPLRLTARATARHSSSLLRAKEPLLVHFWGPLEQNPTPLDLAAPSREPGPRAVPCSDARGDGRRFRVRGRVCSNPILTRCARAGQGSVRVALGPRCPGRGESQPDEPGRLNGRLARVASCEWGAARPARGGGGATLQARVAERDRGPAPRAAACKPECGSPGLRWGGRQLCGSRLGPAHPLGYMGPNGLCSARP
eukprot:scaffold4501_cov395-Prasinococcus_capsulatus_cf.AAC.15